MGGAIGCFVLDSPLGQLDGMSSSVINNTCIKNRLRPMNVRMEK